MSKKGVKQKSLHRAKIISGQIQGLIKMLEQESYCVDVLTQSLAIQKSLQSLGNLLLENHLQNCASEQIKNGKKEKAVEEIMKVYKLNNKIN